MKKHERIAQYSEKYLRDYGFEAVLVSARQRMVVEVLRAATPRVVLEVGCGIDMLGERAYQAGLTLEQWVIVEPNERFFNAARTLEMGGTRVDVVRGFLEDAVDAVRERCIRAPDFIVCSGLLNEVEKPEQILRAAKSLLGTSGKIHVNVPNAYSFHRRLARSMGIVQREDELTARNRQLAQYRVFDAGSLAKLATKAGFRVVEQGGYFVKPFTHAQMESLGSLLTPQMLDGLWQLGRELPELASEIYVNLEPA